MNSPSKIAELALHVQNDHIAYEALTLVAKRLDTGVMPWGEAFNIAVHEVKRIGWNTYRFHGGVTAPEIYQVANDTLNYLSNHVKEL